MQEGQSSSKHYRSVTSIGNLCRMESDATFSFCNRATTTDIQQGPIEFGDYVMEGFVSYHMQTIIDR